MDSDGAVGVPREVDKVKRANTDTAGDGLAKTAGLIVHTAGGDYPLVVTPAGVRAITGDRRSEHAIRDDCSAGVIPTLPRSGGSGSHHRIPVAKLLDQLGVPYTVVPAES